MKKKLTMKNDVEIFWDNGTYKAVINKNGKRFNVAYGAQTKKEAREQAKEIIDELNEERGLSDNFKLSTKNKVIICLTGALVGFYFYNRNKIEKNTTKTETVTIGVER